MFRYAQCFKVIEQRGPRTEEPRCERRARLNKKHQAFGNPKRSQIVLLAAAPFSV